LTALTNKAERKSFTTFGNLKERMTKSFLKNYKMKFGSLGLNTTKLTSVFLPFGIRLTKKIQS